MTRGNVRNNFGHTIRASYLGYVTQSIVNNLAPLLFLIFRDELGFSLRQITFITTLNFTVQLTVDLLSVKLMDKIGYRAGIITAHVFSALGLVSMAVLPFVMKNSYMGMILSVILYAIGGGIIEVLISPIVEACPTENKSSAMSILHSFYCWGTVAVVLLSTVFLFLFGKSRWRILCFIWAALPLANGFYFCFVPINKLVEKDEGMKVGALFKSKLFWIFLFLMITAGASEQAMSQWASAFAEGGLNLSKMQGDVAGPCFFSVLMGLSRVFYGKFAEKIELKKYIFFSGLACVLSYILAVFSPNPVMSLLGCGLCGLSVGIMWPGVFSLASENIPKGGTALFALLALAGDVGCASGPTLVGNVASAFSDNLKAGLLAAVFFPVLLLVFLRGIPKGKKK